MASEIAFPESGVVKMGYGFSPPTSRKEEYTQPPNKLMDVFFEWLENEPEENLQWDEKKREESYRRTIRLIQENNLKPTSTEANSLLAVHRVKTIKDRLAGLFLSACYNLSDEDLIVFDVADEERIDFIGYKCKSTLINNEETGNDFGIYSSGPVINNGATGNHFCWGSSCIAINTCKAGKLPDRTSSGIIITLTEPKDCNPPLKYKLIGPSNLERIPKLKEYLDNLKSVTESIKYPESAKLFAEQFGHKGERIKENIYKILKDGGIEI